jgi:hypothetical protein
VKLQASTADELAAELSGWLDARPGTELIFESVLMNERRSICVALSRGYRGPPPHGTWASIVDVKRKERPLLLAIEQAMSDFERSEAALQGKA